MTKLISQVLVATILTVLNLQAVAADKPVALLEPYSDVTTSITDIPSDYLEPISLDSDALFAYPVKSKHEIVLPRLGELAVVHDRTRIVDPAGTVTRWEGHVQGREDLQVVFAKGISGMVSGVINTSAGRVLLGQMGDYVVYKQSQTLPAATPTTGGDIPQALLDDSSRRNNPPDDNKPAGAAYPVQFNAAALANVPANGEVNLSLPGAGNFRVVHDNTLAGDLGATTFVGYLKDFGDDYRMVVTYSPSGAQGQVLTPYGLYLIQTVGGKQWLIDVNGSGLHHPLPSQNDGVNLHQEAPVAMGGEPLSGNAENAPTATLGAGAKSISVGTSKTAVNKTRIDLLVVYSPGLESEYGGVDQVRTRIQNLVALANQAYVDSGVEISLHLVAAIKVDAPDVSDQMDELNALTKGSGPYSNVAWLRDVYGADLVTLIRPFSMDQGGLCGTGWVGGTNGASISLYRSQGFSVVSDGRDRGYYCSAYTLTHELGHNMGSVHDRATVAEQGGAQGAYPYSFGYGQSGQFGTIMSYIDPEVGKFSNPDIDCKGTAACGISPGDTENSADNALSLNNTRDHIAAYTPEASTTTQMVSIAGVITAQGKALGGVKFDTTPNAKCSSSGDNGSFSCIVASNWSGDITPALAGYSFSPEKLSLTDLTANVADQNFTAQQNKSLSLASGASANSASGGGGAVGFEGLLIAVLLGGFRRRQSVRSAR